MTVTLVFWADDDKWFNVYVNGHYVCEILAVNREHAYMKAHHEWAVKRFLKQMGIENTYMLVCVAVGASTEVAKAPDESFLLHQLAKRIVATPLISRLLRGRKEKERVES